MDFENHPIMKKFYSFCVWVSRLAIVNLLWLLFTLLGLIVLGIGPATVSMFKVIGKWLNSDNEFSTILEFWITYKKEFVRSNIFTVLLLVVGLIMGFNFEFTLSQELPYYVVAIAGAALIIYVAVVSVAFPVYLNIEGTIKDKFKAAILFALCYPINSLILLLVGVGISIILLHVQGLIFFFSGSLIALLSMYRLNIIFKKVKKLQEEEIAV